MPKKKPKFKKGLLEKQITGLSKTMSAGATQAYIDAIKNNSIKNFISLEDRIILLEKAICSMHSVLSNYGLVRKYNDQKFGVQKRKWRRTKKKNQ